MTTEREKRIAHKIREWADEIESGGCLLLMAKDREDQRAAIVRLSRTIDEMRREADDLHDPAEDEDDVIEFDPPDEYRVATGQR
jgi:cell division protein FtsB